MIGININKTHAWYNPKDIKPVDGAVVTVRFKEEDNNNIGHYTLYYNESTDLFIDRNEPLFQVNSNEIEEYSYLGYFY